MTQESAVTGSGKGVDGEEGFSVNDFGSGDERGTESKRTDYNGPVEEALGVPD